MLGRQWWALASVLALGCSKKTDDGAKAEPSPSSSAATPLKTAEEKAPEPPPPALAYKLIKKFAERASFFQLSNGVIMCEQCVIGDKPIDTRPLFSFDGTELKELTGLLSDKRVSGNLGESIVSAMKLVHGGVYRFAGTLPKSIYLQAYGDYDDDNIERNGKAVVERYLKYDGTRWGSVDSDAWYKANEGSKPQGDGRLPRAYDDALLHAPRLGYGFTSVAFGKGPLLVVSDKFLDRWDGKQWHTTEPSWGEVRGVYRLEDGRTIVQATKHFEIIDARGEVSTLALPESASPSDLQLMFVQEAPWIASSSALWIPSEASVLRAKRQPREKTTAAATAASIASAAASVAMPVPAPSDAPAASAVPAPSTAPVDSAAVAASAAPPLPIVSASPAPSGEDLPVMTAFTASCKTPFVVLFTPPNPGWTYGEAAQNLKDAKDLQDKLWFFELRRSKVTYFGAQAEDEASARALMAVYQAKVSKSKPILGCLDAKSYAPDRYQPKHDAEAVLINLRAGFVL